MALTMLHYYFLKQSIEKIPGNIKNNLEYDNDLLFNLSTFNDLGVFYKLFNPVRKDKYRLNELLESEKFYEFILECLHICKRANDYRQFLFIHAMTAHFILQRHVDQYLSVRLSKSLRYDAACNMIDYYYAMAEDNLDLTKTALTDYFPGGFVYYDYMESLIHKPFIKVFSFFCTKSYFTHSMKMKKNFYAHFNRSKTRVKLVFYKLYDILLNHRGKPKASLYLYTSKVDTSLFNLRKKPYLIGETTYTYSLEDIIANALAETKEITDAMVQFISYDNDKPLKKILKIKEI